MTNRFRFIRATPAGKAMNVRIAGKRRLTNTIISPWFANHGEIIVFVSRLLPAIRTFIAFPAGVARMNLKRFVIYTFAGSLPWCLGLAYIGQKLGEKWNQDDTLKTWFHRFDFLIGIAAVLLIGWWIWRHVGHLRSEKADA